LTADGADIDGWHMLMGFLYRPTDFDKFFDGGSKSLLQVLHTDASMTADDLYFNIFPVYAQELAGIATVYCGFNRHPLLGDGNRGNPWSAGESGSPVMDYNQLDENRYREGYNRNPAA
jgi:hypothetical protein